MVCVCVCACVCVCVCACVDGNFLKLVLTLARARMHVKILDQRSRSSAATTDNIDSNFARGTATWRTQQNIRAIFDSEPLAPSKLDVSYMYKVHNVLHCRPVARWGNG